MRAMTCISYASECGDEILAWSFKISTKFATGTKHQSIPYKWAAIGLVYSCLSLMTIVSFVIRFHSSRVPLTATTAQFIYLPVDRNISQKQTSECIVYVQERAGRLANTMFIAATAFGLARLHDCRLVLAPKIIDQLQEVFTVDISSLLMTTPAFHSMLANSPTPWPRINKTIVCHYVVELTRPNAVPRGSVLELLGYCQSYLHFAKFADEIREKFFAAKSSKLEKAASFFAQIYKEKRDTDMRLSTASHRSLKQQLALFNRTTWIGVHIRRTDMGTLNYSSSREYFLFAMRYYIDRFPNALFIVAGDDKPYCETLFPSQPNVVVTPSTFSRGDDMVTLSLCQHSIITAGSFGWWTAFLADGFVIHDTIYPTGCENRAYYYPPWYLVNGYVRAHEPSPFVL